MTVSLTPKHIAQAKNELYMHSMETDIRHYSFVYFEDIRVYNYTCAKLKTHLIMPGRKCNQRTSNVSI